MSIALVKRPSWRGFTLLEITLAMAILGMMSLAIYRFVAANLIVLRVSSEENAAEARYTGLINLVTAQLQNLPLGVGAPPVNAKGPVFGMPHFALAALVLNQTIEPQPLPWVVSP